MNQALTYEASVYKRVVKYVNFKGETQETTLYFALDPLQLLEIIANFKPKKSKSQNPAKRGQEEALTDQEQIKFVRDLAARSAGFPSDDGESWEPFEDFGNTIAGKAFMTQLTASDADRKEFSEKVILDPFRSFVGYAVNDPSNTSADVAQFKTMLGQMENIFQDKPDESLEERRARLAAELESLTGPAEGTQHPNT